MCVLQHFAQCVFSTWTFSSSQLTNTLPGWRGSFSRLVHFQCWISLCWLFFFLFLFLFFVPCWTSRWMPYICSFHTTDTAIQKIKEKKCMYGSWLRHFRILLLSVPLENTHTFVPQLQIVWSRQSINQSINQSPSEPSSNVHRKNSSVGRNLEQTRSVEGDLLLWPFEVKMFQEIEVESEWQPAQSELQREHQSGIQMDLFLLPAPHLRHQIHPQTV